MRTIASLGSYAYATSDQGLWVNLYLQGGMHAAVGTHKVTLDVTTDYPWNGSVKFVVRPEAAARFALNLRIPDWCSGARAQVNGAKVENASVERGYLVLDRELKPGDMVTLDLPMPARRIAANPLVKEDQGQLALARGPLVYCLEGCDNKTPLATVALPVEATLTPEPAPDLPAGTLALKGEGLATTETDWPGGLYRAAAPPHKVTLTAIPYYAWDNRAPGEMRVWLPTTPPAPAPARGPERDAKVTLSFVSGYARPEGIHDGIEPKSSGEQPAALCHWWPHKGGEEWAQYTWTQPINAAGARVYWFDDTGRGECRLPTSWKILYREGDEWKPVTLTDTKTPYPVQRDQWCEVHFVPVKTTELRLVFEMQPNWSAGIHEWKVLEPDEDE